MNIWDELIGLILDWREQFRRGDWRQAVRWIVETFVSLPYCRIEYTVFTRALLEPLPVIKPRLSVTLRLAGEGDLVLFRGLVPPSELRYFARRMAHGRHCFLALDGENLAAYCWATTQVEFAWDNLEIPLRSDDVYVDDAYTVPAYRRRGIQTALHLYRLEYMRDLGCRRAILIVENDNTASRELVRRLGYQVMDHLSFRRILWKRTYRYREVKF